MVSSTFACVRVFCVVAWFAALKVRMEQWARTVGDLSHFPSFSGVRVDAKKISHHRGALPSSSCSAARVRGATYGATRCTHSVWSASVGWGMEVVDLFCGLGGFAAGALQVEGCSVVLGVDQVCHGRGPCSLPDLHTPPSRPLPPCRVLPKPTRSCSPLHTHTTRRRRRTPCR